MQKFLDENAPLELIYSYRVPNFHDFCLWPMATVYSSSNSINKHFVCKNETFDEQGRLILFFSDKIFCELEKLTAELIDKYQPNVHALKDGKNSLFIKFYVFSVTWITRFMNRGGFARILSGWSIFDDYEKSGIPLCSYTPDARLVQKEELALYSSSKAHSLCIYPD